MKPGRRRKLVDEMRGEWGVSIRRTCRVFLVDTSTYHYKSRPPGQAALEQRINEICQTRVRYGYRRVHVLLRRQGWSLGQNKTRRIYREMGLQLTRRRNAASRRSYVKTVASPPGRMRPGRWTSYMLATDRKLRVLTIVDTFSRSSPTPRCRAYGSCVSLMLSSPPAVGRP